MDSREMKLCWWCLELMTIESNPLISICKNSNNKKENVQELNFNYFRIHKKIQLKIQRIHLEASILTLKKLK